MIIKNIIIIVRILKNIIKNQNNENSKKIYKEFFNYYKIYK